MFCDSVLGFVGPGGVRVSMMEVVVEIRSLSWEQTTVSLLMGMSGMPCQVNMVRVELLEC